MIRILLADNHFVIRSGLRALLQGRRNFDICGETCDGQQAVDLAVLKKPDVVVINVNLPIINGIAATRQIRRAVPGAEILIYTAESHDDRVREALSAGAIGYVLKSAPDEQVIQAIGSLALHHPFCSSTVSQRLLNDLTMRVRNDSNGVHLTTRQREILRLIAEGHRGKRIALMLGISLKTVETHRTAAMRKLNLRSIADVVRYAIRMNLIEA